MKTINELEQEAISNAIMQLSCVAKEMTLHMQTLLRNLIEVSEQMRQLQSVSMCISSNEVSGDGSGQALPEVSQEERYSDGWIEGRWGINLPVKPFVKVEVKDNEGPTYKDKACQIDWLKVLAYRIVKGE